MRFTGLTVVICCGKRLLSVRRGGRRRAQRLLGAVVCVMFGVVPAGALADTLVFGLAGQSNMAGRGVPVPSLENVPGVVEFRHGRLIAAQEPLAGGRGVGPGTSFGAGVRAVHPHARVVLVPCAQDGSWLKEWQRGSYLYNRCVRRLRAAAQRTGGTIRGVLFAQGESDAQNPAVAAKWGTRFQHFVINLRQSLHARVPVVFTVLGTTMQPRRFHAWQIVQRQQRSLDLPLTARVETADLPIQDNIHFTVAGYRALGLRLAAGWNRLNRSLEKSK